MRSRVGLALIAALGLFVAACSSSDSDDSGDSGPAKDALKAAWIYVGPANDGGWSQAHNTGREYVATELGSAVETTFKESVPEGAQVEQVIDDLVKDGNKIIFAASYGYGEAMVAAAEKYPEVKFEMATGDSITGGKPVPENYAEYWGAGEDTC